MDTFVFAMVQYMTNLVESDKDQLFKTYHTLITQFMKMELWFASKHLNSQDNHPLDSGLDFVCSQSTILYFISFILIIFHF